MIFNGDKVERALSILIRKTDMNTLENTLTIISKKALSLVEQLDFEMVMSCT